jgi:hypothetical protein
MSSSAICEVHSKLKLDAVAAILESKRIRRSKDVSFYEDSELTRDERRKVEALLVHLLAGHAGKPCPCGPRPIVDYRSANEPQNPRPQALLRSPDNKTPRTGTNR